MNNWTDQFSAPNNAINTLPAMMQDGRIWSSWQPEAVVNEKIQKQEGIKSNWEYRQYLQNNANHIMKYNTMETIYSSGNNPYISSSMVQPSSNTPFLYGSTYDNRMPPYGFSNSDLKQHYLSREQLNAKMVAPTIPTNF